MIISFKSYLFMWITIVIEVLIENNLHYTFYSRPNDDYVQWIMKTESWGGGIELSILAEFYEMEISVVDIQSLHVSKFGEDKNYSQRMLLLYDGIHYDPMYMDPFDVWLILIYLLKKCFLSHPCFLLGEQDLYFVSDL